VKRWLYPYGLLVLILAAGLGARVFKLGAYGFWTDEMYHVVAAQSLNETGTPYLPAYRNGEYTRALPVTCLAAWAFARFGSSEAAARAPFVAVNMAFLAVLFLVVRRWFNVHLALLVVLVLALAPHELVLGREVRMYGLFQLLYFGAAALLYELIETPLGRRRRALLFAIALALLALAAWVQALAVNVAIALGIYSLGMALAGARAGAGGRRPYVVVLGLLAGAALALWLAAPHLVRWLAAAARERPPWAAATPAFPYYSWFFTYYYPVFTFLYLLGAVLLVRDHGRRGWFVVASFVPLMIAHVILFTGRVEERYVSYIFPYFVIAACYAIQLALKPLFATIAAEWKRGAKATAVLLCLAALPLPNLVAHTWLHESATLLRYGYGPNWKTIAPVLHALPADAVVISPWPLHVAYYGGRFPDYILRHRQPEDGTEGTGRLGARTVAQRWLFDAAEFERIAGAAPDVRLITTEWALTNDAYVDAGMRRAIEKLLVRTAHPGDAKVLIYKKPE
jgi:hypothetical protein